MKLNKLSCLWCSILLLMLLLPGVFAFQERIIITNTTLSVETSVDNVTLPLSVPFVYVLNLGMNLSCVNTIVYNSSVLIQNFSSVYNVTTVLNQSVISTVINNNVFNTTILNNTWVQNVTPSISCPACPSCVCPAVNCVVDYEKIKGVVQECLPAYLVSNLSSDIAFVKVQTNISELLLNHSRALSEGAVNTTRVSSSGWFGGNVGTSVVVVVFALVGLLFIGFLFWELLLKKGFEKKRYKPFDEEKKQDEVGKID